MRAHHGASVSRLMLLVLLHPLLAPSQQPAVQEPWVWNVRVSYVEQVKAPAEIGGGYTKRVEAEYRLMISAAGQSWQDGLVRFSDLGRWIPAPDPAGETSTTPQSSHQWALEGTFSLAIKSTASAEQFLASDVRGEPAGAEVKKLALPRVRIQRVGKRVFVSEPTGLSLDVFCPGATSVRSGDETRQEDREISIQAELPKKEKEAVAEAKPPAETDPMAKAIATAKEMLEKAMKAVEKKKEEDPEAARRREEENEIARLERAGFKELQGTTVQGSQQWTSDLKWALDVAGKRLEPVKVSHSLSWEFTLVPQAAGPAPPP